MVFGSFSMWAISYCMQLRWKAAGDTISMNVYVTCSSYDLWLPLDLTAVPTFKPRYNSLPSPCHGEIQWNWDIILLTGSLEAKHCYQQLIFGNYSRRQLQMWEMYANVWLMCDSSIHLDSFGKAQVITLWRLASKVPKGAQSHALSWDSTQPRRCPTD